MLNIHLQKFQERVTKKLRTRRMGVPKSSELSNDYSKQLALFAKRIQTYAKEMGYTKLADIARQYKITIKNAYTDYQKKLKECGYANKSENELSEIDKIPLYSLNGDYYEYVRQLAEELAKIVQEQTQNMVNIYSDVYKFMANFYNHSDSPNIKVPPITSGKVLDKPEIENYSTTPLSIAKPKYNPVENPFI